MQNPQTRKAAAVIVILGAAITVLLRGSETQRVEEQIPAGSEIVGRVVTVADGDTMTLRVDGQKVKVRLQGIDCPERDQAYGKEAGQFVRDLVEGKTVEVKKLGVDQYDRVLGEVFFEGENLNKSLLGEGLAWWYERHARDRTDYRDLQEEARRSKRGLWSEPDAIPPWEFRQKQWDKN